MRRNVFNEPYLNPDDSIVDFIVDNELDPGELNAFIDPDDDGVTYTAEVFDDSGPAIFYVEGYVSELELEEELRDAGVGFVEVSE